MPAVLVCAPCVYVCSGVWDPMVMLEPMQLNALGSEAELFLCDQGLTDLGA